MNKALFLPLAALCAVSLSPILVGAEQPAKPLTEKELLQTIDGLGKGDPLTKKPLSAEPELPRRDAPSVRGIATPRPEPTGSTNKSDTSKTKEKKPGTPMPGSTPGQTEITSEEASFDQKTHQAIFLINVFVKNPDFTLSCEKLTAWLKQADDKPKKGATPAGATPSPRSALPTVEAPGVQVTGAPPKATPGANGPGGGLDKALAEGKVEIIQDKVSDDGTISHNVGHGKTAEYDSTAGSITLRGKPDVQQGINTVEALDEETVIILYRDGRMKTIGRTRNILRESTSAPKTASGTNNGR